MEGSLLCSLLDVFDLAHGVPATAGGILRAQIQATHIRGSPTVRLKA